MAGSHLDWKSNYYLIYKVVTTMKGVCNCLHLIRRRPSQEIFLGLQRYKFPDSIVCQDLDFVLLLLQTNLLIFS